MAEQPVEAEAASVVVDTDVISFLFTGAPQAAAFRPHLDGKILVMSFQTYGEILRWPIENGWGEPRRKRLVEHLKSFVLHPFNSEICHEWAHLMAKAKPVGITIGYGDAWIAATALLHKIPLVTHNKKHFEKIEGLTVLP